MNPDPSAGAGPETAAGETDPLLLAYLAGCDATCPLCGYNLRGLTSPRCPECGRVLRLAVGLAEPYLRAWITLLVTTCAGAGVGAFFVMIVALEGWPPVDGIAFSLLFFMAMIPAAVVALTGRRVFLRWPKEVQWVLADAALIGTGIAAVLLLIALIG